MSRPKVRVKVEAKSTPDVYMDDVWKFLRDSGLFFLITRDVLHPLGLAIVEKDGETRLLDRRSRPTLIMKAEEYRRGQQKLDTYMATRGQVTLDLRKKRLRYTSQPPPEPGT